MLMNVVSIVGQNRLQIWDSILPGRLAAFVTWSSPAVSLTRETQDYAARFGLSSQPLGKFLKLHFLR